MPGVVCRKPEFKWGCILTAMIDDWLYMWSSLLASHYVAGVPDVRQQRVKQEEY